MTVYELIQSLARFEPNTRVNVLVSGNKRHFDEYKDDDDEPSMCIGACPTYIEMSCYGGIEYAEIGCELEIL